MGAFSAGRRLTVLVTVVGLVTACATGASTSPSAACLPSAAVTVAPSPSPSPSVSPTAAPTEALEVGLAWNRVDDPDLVSRPRIGSMYGVIAGMELVGGSPTAWLTSTDGHAWARSDLPLIGPLRPLAERDLYDRPALATSGSAVHAPSEACGATGSRRLQLDRPEDLDVAVTGPRDRRRGPHRGRRHDDHGRRRCRRERPVLGGVPSDGLAVGRRRRALAGGPGRQGRGHDLDICRPPCPTGRSWPWSCRRRQALAEHRRLGFATDSCVCAAVAGLPVSRGGGGAARRDRVGGRRSGRRRDALVVDGDDLHHDRHHGVVHIDPSRGDRGSGRSAQLGPADRLGVPARRARRSGDHIGGDDETAARHARSARASRRARSDEGRRLDRRVRPLGHQRRRARRRPA